MQSLLLAICASALVSIVMRLSEGRVKDKMSFFMANYIVCTLLAAGFTMQSFPAIEQGFGFTLGLGAFSGFLYLYSFVLFRQNVGKNGVVMSSTFMKLGVLIPTIMAILVFREQPRLTQLLGIALAAAAIVLLNFQKEAAGEAKGKWLLLALLVVSGFTDGTSNIFDKLGNPIYKDFFLVFIFLTAFCCSAAAALLNRSKISPWDILFGVAIGIPNYFSSRFLLKALATVPAVVVYPVFSVGTIVVITVVGVLAFHEKLDKRKIAALLMIFAALSLLNV